MLFRSSTPDTAGATFPSASPEAEADELPITPASERSRGHVIEDLVTILDALDHENRLDEETMGSAVVTALLLLLSGAGVSLATSLATQMAGGAGTRSTGTSMAGAGSSSEVATSGLRAAPLAPPELPTDAPPVSPSTGPAAREASVEASDEAPPRSPCAEERARMQETSRTARLLNQELQRLQRLLHRMDLAYENARQAGFANGLIDAGLFALGNSLDLQWRAVRTLGLARGAMTPAMRVAAQAIYAEAAERVRAMANGSPQEMSSVVINAGAAGAQQAVQESLARALAERLKKLPAEIVREIGYPAVAPSLRRLIEELAADGAQQVSNIFSLGLSAGSVKIGRAHV